jgi:hypothetical protein
MKPDPCYARASRAPGPSPRPRFFPFVAQGSATPPAEAARPVPALPILAPHAGSCERFRGLGTFRHMGRRA